MSRTVQRIHRESRTVHPQVRPGQYIHRRVQDSTSTGVFKCPLSLCRFRLPDIRHEHDEPVVIERKGRTEGMEGRRKERRKGGMEEGMEGGKEEGRKRGGMEEGRAGRRKEGKEEGRNGCLLYTSPSPRDDNRSRMPSSA